MTDTWSTFESEADFDELFPTAILEVLKEVKIKPRNARKNPLFQELLKIKEGRLKEGKLSRTKLIDSPSDDVWGERLRESMRELEMQKGAERTYKIMKKLSPFMDGLKSLMQICESLVQDAPFGVSIAFTGLRMVLFLTFDVPTQLDIIMEALEEVGDMLKFCQRLIKYDSDPHFQKLLVRSYKDIIGFWITASEVLSGNILKVIAKNIINSLRVVIKEALDKLRTHSQGLKDYALSTGLLRADQAFKEAAQDKKKKLRDDIALWIRGNDNLDIDDDAAEQLGRRHEGTCKWILEEKVFEDWRDATNGSILWYHAPPGSGKSVLAASVIDYLRKRNEKVAAFFYSYSSDTKRYGLNGLRSLALQLLSMNQNIPDRTIQLFEEKKIYNTTVQSSSIATALIQQLLSPLDHAYLIIDGLDECSDKDQLIGDLSGLVQQKVYATVKWLFLSRYHDSFRSNMSNIGAQELHPKSDVINVDIQTYVASTLTCENCFNKCSDDDDRNFLYARFVCETLRGDGTLRDGDIPSALRQFPTSLTSYYARSIDEIARRPSHEQRLVRMAFIILVAAKQSLTFGELMDALSVKLESPNNQRSRLRQPDEIRNLCGPLITLERRDEDAVESHIVKFYHKTIKDFLLQDPDVLKLESIETDSRKYFVTKEDAQREMGMLCLSYLMDQQYSECQDLETLVQSVDKDKDQAFLRYATTFWCQHLSEAKPTPKMVEQVTQFLKSKAFWTCIGVQSHTAPHLFGSYIPLKSDSYRMSSKAYKWNGEDAYGLPLPDWLDDESATAECTSLVRSLCCFTQEWNEVITSHTASIGLCGLLRRFDTSCYLKPLSKVDRRPRIDHLSELVDLTGHSSVRILDIKFRGKRLSAEVLFQKDNETESIIHKHEAEVAGKVLETSQHNIPLSGDQGSWDINEIEGEGLEAWSIDPRNLSVRITTSLHSKRFKSSFVAKSDFSSFEGGEWTFLRAATESPPAQDKRVRVLHAGWLEKDRPQKFRKATSDETEDDMTDPDDSESEAEVDSDSDVDSTSDIFDSLDGYESMTTDSSVDDEGKRTGQCIIILQPQEDPYWTKPWMSSAMRWDKVGCAMHPNLPLLAFTHTSLEIELVNLDLKTQETKHLPEPVNINGKPASSTRELRFSSCGKYLHCLIITFVNAFGQTNCQVTVATFCFDSDGDSDNAFLLIQSPLQFAYSFADKLDNIALPLTLTYWAEDSLLISLPPLTCDAKIIRVDLPNNGVHENTQIKTLTAPIYFPSSTPHRDPRLLQRTSSDGKDIFIHLALGALFPPKREISPVQPRSEVQDGTRIGRRMDQASPPVFLRWRISQDDGWRSWNADLDGKSSDLRRETPVWEALRGDFVDPNKPFSVPIRSGLNWTRKGYLSC